MPLIIKPTTVVKEHHFTTETQRGEITVNINLTLTLQVDQTGEIKVSATPTVEPSKRQQPVMYIPELEPVNINELIDFGKDVN